MKTIKIFIQALILFFITQHASAQIGYQVSLLNSATGEPRASETVSVSVTLSNSEGKIIHTETKTETTNDFGILSLAVGNENTFNDVDWNKLPFFISVSVDGKLVGKSQVLTVPVAEYAKKTGVLTKEILCSKTWSCEIDVDEVKMKLTFNNDNTIKMEYIIEDSEDITEYTTYYINGNTVYFLAYNGRVAMLLHYIHQTHDLVSYPWLFK